jgi:hypothetical protein
MAGQRSGARLLSSLSAHAAIIGFSGSWAPPTWTTTILGDVNPGGGANGSVDTSGAPGSITLNGGNDPTDVLGCPAFLACEIDFSHAVAGATGISFDWDYASNDSAGAQLDAFGVIIDGAQIQLSDPGGQSTQHGHSSFEALHSFAFYMNCGDCLSGNAVVNVSQLRVPEPATLALVGLGLLGFGAQRRARRA